MAAAEKVNTVLLGLSQYQKSDFWEDLEKPKEISDGILKVVSNFSRPLSIQLR